MTIKDKYCKTDFLTISKFYDGDFKLVINEKPNRAVILLGKFQIEKLKKYLNENSKNSK